MRVDNCSDKPYVMSEWIGFDGANNGAVLQAGTASTACSTSFVAWYEWFILGRD
ncbi:MAG: G1 family glutamic endopeptidase [Terriglobales bacterium]